MKTVSINSDAGGFYYTVIEAMYHTVCTYPTEIRLLLSNFTLRMGHIFLILLETNVYSFIEELLKRGIPTVAVGKYYKQIDCIYPDVKKGTSDEVSYLIECGHKKIAFVNCPLTYSASQARSAGFRDACERHGGQVIQTWETHCQQNTGAGGYEAIKALWESGARPDAIATANEPIALGVMRE